MTKMIVVSGEHGAIGVYQNQELAERAAQMHVKSTGETAYLFFMEPMIANPGSWEWGGETMYFETEEE